MAIVPDDKHEEPTGERQPSFLASFSQADLRLLLITFAGTVAANVVTVMVVAVALIAARPKNSERPTVASVLILALFGLIGVFIVARGAPDFRRKRARGTTTVTLRVLTVVMGLMTLEILLVLLGYAVGVK